MAARREARRPLHALLRRLLGLHLPGLRHLAGHDDDRYTGPFNRPTAAPLLLVNSRFDAASSYERAQRVERTLANARLLTIEGAGHTQATIDSPCADQASRSRSAARR